MNYLAMSESSERRDERNRHLTELYCEIFDTIYDHKVNDKRKTSLFLALNLLSPRYNVGFDRAYVVVGCLLRDENSIKFKSKVIKEMWLEITAKTHDLMRDGKLSIAKSLDIVLENCRASRCFMTEAHAWNMIKKELSKMNIRKPYGRKTNE